MQKHINQQTTKQKKIASKKRKKKRLTNLILFSYIFKVQNICIPNFSIIPNL